MSMLLLELHEQVGQKPITTANGHQYYVSIPLTMGVFTPWTLGLRQ